jgi:RNA polymerase sigma-70 factor (ECF subfamily)
LTELDRDDPIGSHRARRSWWPTPVIHLNHAVAVAMADGAAAGLVVLHDLEKSGQLAGYHLLPATRADLPRRLGHRREAAASYRQAIPLARTDAERRYLARRLAELADHP